MTPRVCVVGLGPGPDDLVSARTLRLIAEHPVRYLRTTRHPSAHLVSEAPGVCENFDELYESIDWFEDLYAEIADALVAAALEHGAVLYAVPGSPLVLERTVELLRDRPEIDVDVHSAISFLDEAWRALDIDPVSAGVRLADAHDVRMQGIPVQQPVLIAHTHDQWTLSEIKLSMNEPWTGMRAVICHHLGLPDERVVEVDWADLDRTLEPDHLTCVWVPSPPSSVGTELARFHGLSLRLRAECPWDREQTHASLVRYLQEETYELIEAIEALDAGGSDEDFIEELGDVLYQVAFHCAIAEEDGRFDLGDVAAVTRHKLVERHPHVFGDVKLDSAEDVVVAWDEVKKREKPERTGIFDGLVEAMPALLLADKAQRRASREGYDWPQAAAALGKVSEESVELAAALAGDGDVAAELGDLLFSAVNVARLADVDPEAALRAAVRRFRERVELTARMAADDGRRLADLSAAELDELWQRAKAREPGRDAAGPDQ